MAKEAVTQRERIIRIELDIEYIKLELKDVKRLEYLLLGLFVTFFALLVAAFIGIVIKQ